MNSRPSCKPEVLSFLVVPGHLYMHYQNLVMFLGGNTVYLKRP